jgi:predicted outer membrane repeat protein
VNVKIDCATVGVTIHYTTNGADPTPIDPSVEPGASVLVTPPVTLKARAYKLGWGSPSEVKSALFDINRVIYVKPAGNNTKSGLTWADAKKGVQAGIDAARANDEVWVMKGTYQGLITLKQGVSVYGGFAGTETIRDKRNSKINVTTLDGNQAGSVVTAAAGTTPVTVIDGFTIKNGYSVVDYPASGGGVYCDGDASPTISNNTITACNAQFGCGISAAYGAPVITSNTITGNGLAGKTTGGGGIYLSGPAIIHYNTIISNKAVTYGGGIYCYGNCSPIIMGNMIAKNTLVWKHGSGICLLHSDGGSGKIVNNTIVDNVVNSDLAGGAIYNDSSSDAREISNNIVAFNSSGIINAASNPVMRYNCAYGNTSYNDALGEGSFSTDPGLISRTTGNYHLSTVSPCIDAGMSDVAGLPLFDIDGQGRILGYRVDIGADELWTAGNNIPGDLKRSADGASFSSLFAVVTANFGDWIYVENTERTCGISVYKPGNTFALGKLLSISGKLKTNVDGERYIEATGVSVNTTGIVEPLAMTNKALGGGDWLYDPSTGGGQMGVADGEGLNNIGLLVKTIGKVTVVEDDYFYVDDGTHARDASIMVGVRVRCGVIEKPVAGQYVSVTGISSIIKINGRHFRSIRPRTEADIAVLQ